MCDDGFSVKFSAKECVVTHDDTLLLKGVRSPNNCYVVPNSHSEHCNLASLDSESLWHERLGHINLKELTRISKREVVRGLPKVNFRENVVCGDCQLGKQIRATHKNLNHLGISKPLELLHMDLMGPTRIQSLGGKRYILLLVDDFSRFVWSAFLREKADTFDLFSDICHRLMNEIHCFMNYYCFIELH